MNFSQAIGSGFANTFNYKTRASRSEFWWFGLFSFFFLLVGAFTGPFVFVFLLILYLPSLAVSVRRFHDTNHRGWWILVPFLVLLLGSEYISIAIDLICIIYLGFIKGTEGENRFGPDPLASAPAGASDKTTSQGDRNAEVHVHVHMPEFVRTESAPTDSDKASPEEQTDK